jgi:predicted dehydrogenase
MARLPRIGFIGCGNHASQNLYPALRLGVFGSPALSEPIGELVACCDLDEGKARRNARAYGFERWHTDYRTMLEREELDCCFVVMNPKLQTEIAIDVLDAGKPVFVEKPATPTLEGALRLKAACARSGAFLQIAFMKRFSEPYRHMLEQMHRPEFGPPTCYEARYTIGRYHPFEAYDFINGFACHHLDLARFVMGEVESVFALYASRQGGAAGRPLSYREVSGQRDAKIAQEETWLLSLQFASGAVGFLQTNCLERIQERVCVTGHGGWVVVDDWRRVTAYVGDGDSPYVWEPNTQIPNDRMDPRTLHGYTGEVRAFVEAVRDGRAGSPGIDDGIAHAKLELAAKRSLLENRPVRVAEIES